METAKCQPHGTEYPWTQDCPECVKEARELGMSVGDYYHFVRPTLGIEPQLSMSMFASRDDYERAVRNEIHAMTIIQEVERNRLTRAPYSRTDWVERGYCIAGPQCRCKGLDIEQRQGCEEWTNAD